MKTSLQLMGDTDSISIQDNAANLLTTLVIASASKETSFIAEDFVRDILAVAFTSKADAFFKLLTCFVNNHGPKMSSNDNGSPVLKVIIEQFIQIKRLLNQENKTRLGPYGNITLCGRDVIAVMEFIDSIIRANIKTVNKEIMELDMIRDCFSVFFRCCMNSFAHTVVVKIVDGILNVSSDEDLKIYLLNRVDLLNLILKELKNSNQKDERGYCHGLYAYGGHLYRMAYLLIRHKNEKLVAIIQANKEWREFTQGEFVQVSKNYFATDVWYKIWDE